MSSYLDACKRIWDGYKFYSSGLSVARKGYESVQMTLPTENHSQGGIIMTKRDYIEIESQVGEAFARRGESALEHQAKTAWLCSVFASNFSSFFGVPRIGYAPPDIWYLITLLLTHDSTELIIGDILDDGSPLHDSKNEVELNIFKKFINAYSASDRETLLGIFSRFQDKSSPDGQALYALDKLEAVLTVLYQEKCGNYGYEDGLHTPSERDAYFMQITGSNLTGDCWAAHCKSVMKDMPVYVSKPVLMLIDVAVQDVRGKKFSWWYNDIPPWKP